MARTLISAVKDNGPSEISRGAPMLPRFQRAVTELVRCQRQLVCPVMPVNGKNAAEARNLSRPHEVGAKLVTSTTEAIRSQVRAMLPSADCRTRP